MAFYFIYIFLNDVFRVFLFKTIIFVKKRNEKNKKLALAFYHITLKKEGIFLLGLRILLNLFIGKKNKIKFKMKKRERS